jgi:hypothetical protein
MTVAQFRLTPPDQKWSVSSLCLSCPVAQWKGRGSLNACAGRFFAGGHVTGTRDEASDPSRRSHFCLAANPLGMRPTAEEVNQMKLFTSLAVIALSLGGREEGQSLASEIVALALLVLAFFGALFLFKTMT